MARGEYDAETEAKNKEEKGGAAPISGQTPRGENFRVTPRRVQVLESEGRGVANKVYPNVAK
jgi:hypothetical protein